MQGPSSSKETMAMHRRFIVEWAQFRAVPGTDEATMLQASRAMQLEFLDRQDGFIRRELFKGPNDRWADLLYWDRPEALSRQHRLRRPVDGLPDHRPGLAGARAFPRRPGRAADLLPRQRPGDGRRRRAQADAGDRLPARLRRQARDHQRQRG